MNIPGGLTKQGVNGINTLFEAYNGRTLPDALVLNGRIAIQKPGFARVIVELIDFATNFLDNGPTKGSQFVPVDMGIEPNREVSNAFQVDRVNFLGNAIMIK